MMRKPLVSVLICLLALSFNISAHGKINVQELPQIPSGLCSMTNVLYELDNYNQMKGFQFIDPEKIEVVLKVTFAFFISVAIEFKGIYDGLSEKDIKLQCHKYSSKPDL